MPDGLAEDATDTTSNHQAPAPFGALLVRQLFVSHPLPMWVYDLETLRFLDANEAAIAAYGYPRDELLTMRVTDVRPEEDVASFTTYVEQTVRAQRWIYRPPRYARHRRKNGQIREVEVAAHHLTFEGHEAVLAVITDITDRLRAERERDALLAQVRHEAAAKAAILEQMADAVLVADSQGRVVMANRSAHTLFGVPDGFWEHGPASRVWPWPSLPWKTFGVDGVEISPAERTFARALHGETALAELRIVTEAGREAWISTSASPLRDDRGEITGVVWIGRETTEERYRREREEQGEKLRALGQMASGVAHDLNQYLGLVAGYADLATRSLDGTPPHLGAAREALDVVARAAMDGSESVKRLLAFARPTQDGPAEIVDVGSLLREVATLTAPRWRDAAQQQGCPISTVVEITGETLVLGWPSALREAITNLIFNAVDALPEGGVIRLSAQTQGDRVIVEVADTGIGIPQEALRRVFEPFFTTKGARGNGLGLAIVYGIVERHDGVVSVSSPPGKGTSVSISLPATSAAPTAPPKKPDPAPARLGLRVLVVDDEPSIARMVAMMLAPHGHDVTTVASGEQALDTLTRSDAGFDLVLSDLGLGDGMNGWELLDRVRQHAPSLRFILSTGWGAQIDPADVVARGGQGLLAKPYRLSDLLEAVAGPA